METEDYDMQSFYNNSPLYREYKNLPMKSAKGVDIGQELAKYYIEKQSCYNKNPFLYAEANIYLPFLRGDKIEEILQDDAYDEVKKREYIKCTLDAIFSGKDNVNRFNTWFTNFSIKPYYENNIIVGATYPKGSFPAAIFSIKIANTSDFSFIYNEAMIGICALNNIIAFVPNFVYTYALKECSSFYTYENTPKVCTGVGDVPYLLTETIQNGKTYADLLRDNSTGREDILNIFLQVINALCVANQEYAFTHYNMLCSNVMCTNVKNKTYIMFQAKAKTTTESYYLGVSKYVGKIIHYENASISYDGLQFGISEEDKLVRDRSRCELVDIAMFLSDCYMLLMTRRDKNTAKYIALIYNTFFNSINKEYRFRFDITKDESVNARALYTGRSTPVNYYNILYTIIGESTINGKTMTDLFLSPGSTIDPLMIYNNNKILKDIDSGFSSYYIQTDPKFTNSTKVVEYIDAISVLTPEDRQKQLKGIKETEEDMENELEYIRNTLVNVIKIAECDQMIAKNRIFLLTLREFFETNFTYSRSTILQDRVKQLLDESIMIRYKKDTIISVIEHIKNLKKVSPDIKVEKYIGRIDFYYASIQSLEKCLYQLDYILIPEQKYTMRKLLSIAEADPYKNTNLINQYKKEYYFNILSNESEIGAVDKITSLAGPSVLYFFKNVKHPSNRYTRNFLLLGEMHDNYNLPKCFNNTMGVYEFIIKSTEKSGNCIDFFNETGYGYNHKTNIEAGGVIRDMYNNFLSPLDNKEKTVSKYIRYHSVDYRRRSIDGENIGIADWVLSYGMTKTTTELYINKTIYDRCVEYFLGDFDNKYNLEAIGYFFLQTSKLLLGTSDEENVKNYLNRFFKAYKEEYEKRFRKIDWIANTPEDREYALNEFKNAYRIASNNRYQKNIEPYIVGNTIKDVFAIYIAVTANIMDVLAIARFFTIYERGKRSNTFYCEDYNKYLVIGAGEEHIYIFVNFLIAYTRKQPSLAIRATPNTQCIVFPEPFSMF
jgi:hypothetical protein